MIKKIIIFFLICSLLAFLFACTGDNDPELIIDRSSEIVSILETNTEKEEVTHTEPIILDSINEPVVLPDAVYIHKKGIRVAIEPAVELYAVILSLLDRSIATHLNIDYKKSISEFFSNMADHDTVSFVNLNLGEKLKFDMSYVITLLINNDFTLDINAYEHIMNVFPEWHTDIDIYEFIDMLKSFYIDSNFEEFYNEHRDFYYEIVNNTADTLPDWDIIGAMESFYGKTMESYNIVLSSMLWDGGFGPGLLREENLACYAIIGPGKVDNGFPVFRDTEGLTALLLHEFGHTFIALNEANECNPEIKVALHDSEFLFERIRYRMVRSGYPTWLIAGEELVLRAAVIRILEENHDVNVEMLLQNEFSQGFLYINDVYELLQIYIDNRDIYPVFDDFIPTLLDELIVMHTE